MTSCVMVGYMPIKSDCCTSTKHRVPAARYGAITGSKQRCWNTAWSVPVLASSVPSAVPRYRMNWARNGRRSRFLPANMPELRNTNGDCGMTAE